MRHQGFCEPPDNPGANLVKLRAEWTKRKHAEN